MAARYLGRFVIAAGAVAASLASPAQPNDEPAPLPVTRAFNVRVHPRVSNEALTFVAREGEPSVSTVEQGVDVQALLRTKCGDVRPAYLSETRALNPGAIDAGYRTTRAGELRLAACPRYVRNVQITVVDEISVEDFLSRETGFRGPVTREDFRRRNPNLTGLIIPAGTTVTLGYVSVITPIVLRESSTYTPESASARLAELAAVGGDDDSVTASDAVPGYMIPDLHQGTVGGPAVTCNQDQIDRPWPLDADALMDALGRAASESGAEVTDANIAILDTAFLPPPRAPFLWHRVVRARGSATNARNHYGLHAVTRTDPPLAQFDFRNGDHGTMVATLALGGRDVLAAATNDRSRVRVRLYSIINPPRSSEPPQVQEGYVLAAIQDAVANETFIINTSFSFHQKTTLLEEVLNHDPRLLIVAAAGNSPADISAQPRWPASYGGIRGLLPAQVVTVAASDRSGALAPYSAYSSSHVDLAAPGCAVPTLGPDLQELNATGTSFAAPIVSYTAGLIRQFGIIQPRRIKERLLVATDVRRDLYNHVWASGVLNPVKAVDLFHDRLEVDGQSQPLRGRVDFHDTGTLTCSNEQRQTIQGDILKIARLDGADSSEWLVIWRTAAGNLDRCIANLAPEQIIFDNGTERSVYNLADVRELIVRSLEPREN